MDRIRKVLRLYHASRVFAAAAMVSLLLAGGAVSASLVDDAAVRTTLLFLVGFGVLFALFMSFGVLYLGLREHDRQIRSFINLRPFYGSQLLRTDGWAADPHMLEGLVLLLQEKQPTAILELGSGATTVVTAEFLRAQGKGRLISVDHEARFAEATKAQLVARGLEAYVDFVVAPLSKQTVDGREYNWYTADWQKSIDRRIDFLVVDGPPARLGANARHPALPVLTPYLAPDCTIVLDDGNRRDERLMAADWAATFKCTARHAPFGKGIWVLERRPEYVYA